MERDKDTGVEPVANDGEPAVEDLEARRKQRKDKGNGSSVKDRAAEGDPDETEEEEDGQFAMGLWEFEEGRRKVTLGTLIRRGTPVEYRVTMGSKSIPGTGGLIDPEDANILLLVRASVGDVTVRFTRKSDETIEKATIYLTLVPKVVQNAKTEAAQVMLHGEPPSSAATS